MTNPLGRLNGYSCWLLPVVATAALGIGSWLLTASAQDRAQARVGTAAAITIEKRLTVLETIVPVIQKDIDEIKTGIKGIHALMLERASQ